MANAYSIIRRQQPYIQAVDVEDIRRTMAVKQQNYDYNVAQVNQAIATFGSIDLIRQEDKKYLYDNLKQVIDTVENTDGLDFSKSGLGSQLSAHISKAIDSNVIKQAKNTMAIRRFDSSLEELKKESPELYSSINEKDARYMSGYYQYMNGETDKIGSMSYTPFTDVEGKMLDRVKTLKDIYPDYEVELPDPSNPGYMKKVKASQLNGSEWKQVLTSSLTSVDRAQLAINARNQFNYSDEAAVGMVEDLKSQIVEEYDSLIEKKRVALIGADDYTTEALETEIEELKKSKTSALTKLPQGKTAGEIGGFFLEEKLTTGYANTLSKSLDLGLTKDEAYFARLKAMEKSGLANGVSDGVYYAAIPKDTDADLGVLVNEFDSQYARETEDLRSDLSKTYQQLSDTNKKEIDTLEKSIIEEYTKDTGEAPSEFVLHRLVIEQAASRNILPISDKIRLKDKLDQVDKYSKSQEEALTAAANEFIVKNADRIVDEFTSIGNNSIKMFGLSSGPANIKDVFAKNNIKTTGDLVNFLKKDSEEARVLKANFLLQTADDIVDVYDNASGWDVKAGAIVNKLTGVGAVQSSLGSSIFGVKSNVDKYTQRRVEQAAKLLGESPDDIYKKDSKIRSIIDATKQNIDSTAVFSTVFTGGLWKGYDNSIRTDNMSKLFGDDEFIDIYEKKLGVSSAKLASRQQIIVAPKIGKDKSPLHNEILNMTSATTYMDPNKPFSLTPNDDGTMTVYQITEYKQGKDSWSKRARVGTINMVDITPDNTPEIYKTIDFQKSKSDIDFLGDYNRQVSNINYLDDSATMGGSLAQVFNPNTLTGAAAINMATKSQVVPTIKSNLDKLGMSQSKRGTEYYSIINGAIRNANKFSLEIEQYGGVSKVAVSMEDKNGDKKLIHRIPVSSDLNNTDFKNLWQGVPQVFVSSMLEDLGRHYLESGDFSKLEKIKNNLR